MASISPSGRKPDAFRSCWLKSTPLSFWKMPDYLTPEQRSRAMKWVKLRDGSLEKLMQIELRARGFRFKRHVRTLPGRPDIVFPKERLAVFVDGDFWHGWRLSTWQHKLSEFWREKLHANRARDQRNFRRLRA